MKLLTKSVVVATVLCFVAGLSAGAAVSSYSPGAGDLLAGENLLALPVVPTDLDGSGRGPGYPEWILAGFDLTGTNLQRWDAATQTLLSRGAATFGNLLSSDGYRLTTAIDAGPPSAFSFNGANDLQQTDYWISLPKTGTTVVGNPYLYAVDWNKISVTNGMTTVSIDTAITNGWLTAVAGFENGFKESVRVGPSSSMPASPQGTTDLDSTRLEPWRGYVVTSLVDNLALIVTARKATDNVYSISGTVTLSETSYAPACPVVIELRDGAGNKVIRTVKHLGASGEYTLDGVAPGTYSVAIKGATTTAAIVSGVTVAGADVPNVNATLLVGDVNGDNYIDLLDFGGWKAAIDTTWGDPTWNVRADLNNDGYVDLVDFGTWKANIDQAGDENW